MSVLNVASATLHRVYPTNHPIGKPRTMERRFRPSATLQHLFLKPAQRMEVPLRATCGRTCGMGSAAHRGSNHGRRRNVMCKLFVPSAAAHFVPPHTRPIPRVCAANAAESPCLPHELPPFRKPDEGERSGKL